MKSWWLGGLLFLSLAINITLGAMLAGRGVGQRTQAAQVAFERLERLPDKERAIARETFKKIRPLLRRQVQEMRVARQAAFEFIASEGYNRATAELRLAELRTRTTAVQELSQRLLLDIADQLPAEQRAALLRRGERQTP